MKNLLKKEALAAAGILLSLALSILGLVGNNQSSNPNKLSGLTNYDEVAAGNAAVKFKTLSLGSGEITTVYTNNSKTSEIVRLANITSDGTASSSYKLYLIATTSASVPASHNFTAIVPEANKRILVWTLATSTTATTTNNLLQTVIGGSDGMVVLKTGESALLALQKGDMTCKSLPAINGCETATSTARGFNVSSLLELVSTSTVR